MKTNSIGKSFTIEKILKIDFQDFHISWKASKNTLSGKKVGEKWLNYLQVTKFFPDFLFPDQYFSPIFFTWQRIYRDSFQLLLLFFFFFQFIFKIYYYHVFFMCFIYRGWAKQFNKNFERRVKVRNWKK